MTKSRFLLTKIVIHNRWVASADLKLIRINNLIATVRRHVSSNDECGQSGRIRILPNIYLEDVLEVVCSDMNLNSPSRFLNLAPSRQFDSQVDLNQRLLATSSVAQSACLACFQSFNRHGFSELIRHCLESSLPQNFNFAPENIPLRAVAWAGSSPADVMQ
jgi:hypothetical protein